MQGFARRQHARNAHGITICLQLFYIPVLLCRFAASPLCLFPSRRNLTRFRAISRSFMRFSQPFPLPKICRLNALIHACRLSSRQFPAGFFCIRLAPICTRFTRSHTVLHIIRCFTRIVSRSLHDGYARFRAASRNFARLHKLYKISHETVSHESSRTARRLASSCEHVLQIIFLRLPQRLRLPLLNTDNPVKTRKKPSDQPLLFH